MACSSCAGAGKHLMLMQGYNTSATRGGGGGPRHRGGACRGGASVAARNGCYVQGPCLPTCTPHGAARKCQQAPTSWKATPLLPPAPLLCARLASLQWRQPSAPCRAWWAPPSASPSSKQKCSAGRGCVPLSSWRRRWRLQALRLRVRCGACVCLVGMQALASCLCNSNVLHRLAPPRLAHPAPLGLPTFHCMSQCWGERRSTCSSLPALVPSDAPLVPASAAVLGREEVNLQRIRVGGMTCASCAGTGEAGQGRGLAGKSGRRVAARVAASRRTCSYTVLPPLTSAPKGVAPVSHPFRIGSGTCTEEGAWRAGRRGQPAGRHRRGEGQRGRACRQAWPPKRFRRYARSHSGARPAACSLLRTL